MGFINCRKCNLRYSAAPGTLWLLSTEAGPGGWRPQSFNAQNRTPRSETQSRVLREAEVLLCLVQAEQNVAQAKVAQE